MFMAKLKKITELETDYVLKNRLQSTHRMCICKGGNLANGRFLRCSVYLSLRTPLSYYAFQQIFEKK